jgi:hypothetical protein
LCMRKQWQLDWISQPLLQGDYPLLPTPQVS